jgi:hypothetical protein
VELHRRTVSWSDCGVRTLRPPGGGRQKRGRLVMQIMGEDYRVDELAAEAGRMILFLLAGGAWTFLMILLAVD